LPKLADLTFVCIDCEATGLDSDNDKILEIAVVKFTLKEIVNSFSSLVNPCCEIPQESIEIHKITQELVKGAPKIETLLPQVIELIGTNIIVGHGVLYDVNLIVQACKRAHLGTRITHNLTLDTLRLARHYGESPTNSLERLCQHFHIPCDETHRALADVMMNIEVFKHLVARYQTLEQLEKILSKPIFLKEMPLGKHKGRLMSEVPIKYLHWAADKDFDQDLLFTIRSEINRRKQGGQFKQAANPFSIL
jgi:DNA polymerase-3 subunit epsilon